MTSPEDLKACLRPGSSYLLENLPWELRYRAVESHLRSGGKAVVLTRIHPRRLKEQFDLGGADVVWLSAASDDGGKAARTLGPGATVKVHSFLCDFLSGNEGGWAMLDGAEYIVSHAGFDSTMKLIQLVNETATVSKGVFIVPLNSDAVAARELGILRRELLPVDARGLAAFVRARSSETPDGLQKDN